jgi:hypothetical protein
MADFNRMLYNCEKSSTISNRLVDEFLLPLCAREEGLDKKFAGMLANYPKVILKMPENWPLWLTSQYVVFQIFRKDGLAPKYLNHFQVRRRSAKELDYLKFQIEHPWRFVFCSIEQNPKDCFFEMKDILTGENFLLYSPGIAETEKQQGAMSLYFILIGFNGECWQTYGINAYFKGIQPFDILYFAKQFKPDLVLMNEIPVLIDEDPLPFMMLWVGAELPLSFHKEDMVVIVGSDFKQEEFDAKKFSQDFIVKQKSYVYMFSLKRWHGFPHFCKCFYDIEKKILSLNAMTNRGYAKLVNVLNQAGYDFSKEPDVRVSMAMVSIIKQVLGREVEPNPYEKLFAEKPSPDNNEELARINGFLKILMDALNSGVDYDLRELASLSGIELEMAKEIAEQVGRKFKLQ